MDIGKAAEILQHYIVLALGDKVVATNMHQELSDAVFAFKNAARTIEELDARTAGLIRYGAARI